MVYTAKVCFKNDDRSVVVAFNEINGGCSSFIHTAFPWLISYTFSGSGFLKKRGKNDIENEEDQAVETE